ncbi:hypothetical protein IPZ61_00070 [Streptomyces sioyaensis]|uniref:hypothetical protein n=1 Tax=Streptomyces sioyaensis TaxID=67364 RepID=UPI001F4211B0|nr:hypothetical protein [Streptomyces sioyaensis]MCF3171748.1 hypothetical protein [Streptomyces sioyaensis]
MTALLAELNAQVHRDHPQVTLLEVRELDDPVVAHFPDSLGMQVTGYWRGY